MPEHMPKQCRLDDSPSSSPAITSGWSKSNIGKPVSGRERYPTSPPVPCAASNRLCEAISTDRGRVLGELWCFRDNHATAAGTAHSDRAACDRGAIVCADRGVPRVRLCRQRSALYGIDLLRHGRCRRRCAVGPGQDAAPSRRLLRVLRRRSWRRHGASDPPPVFVTLQRQYQRLAWLEATEAMPTVRVGSNAQARAPPLSV